MITHLADDGFGNLLESPGGGWIRQANAFRWDAWHVPTIRAGETLDDWLKGCGVSARCASTKRFGLAPG